MFFRQLSFRVKFFFTSNIFRKKKKGQANCIFSHLLGQYPKRWLNRHPVTASAFGIFILTHGGDQYPTVPPERDLFLCSTRKKKNIPVALNVLFILILRNALFSPPFGVMTKKLLNRQNMAHFSSF